MEKLSCTPKLDVYEWLDWPEHIGLALSGIFFLLAALPWFQGRIFGTEIEPREDFASLLWRYRWRTMPAFLGASVLSILAYTNLIEIPYHQSQFDMRRVENLAYSGNIIPREDGRLFTIVETAEACSQLCLDRRACLAAEYRKFSKDGRAKECFFKSRYNTEESERNEEIVSFLKECSSP